MHFFSPPSGRESREQTEIRKVIENKCKAERAEFIVRRTELVKVAGGENSGRPFNLVRIEHARDLYEQIHRIPVITMSNIGCFIRRDPSSIPVRKKQLISLEGFVRYKSFFRIFRSPTECVTFIDELGSLKAAYYTTDVHDPRMLPLHIFDAEGNWENLEDVAQLREFRSRFGGGATRFDRCRREWANPKALHGRDILRVNGVEIPMGYHWDVTRKNGDERITTAHEVWKLPGSNSYCNIYPDGYIRPGQGNGKNRSKRVWP
ncbi:hypothetical protein ACFFS2_04380 [Streptomyces aurantiacus]|uniref:hypothetical protein n=1 Tax=Streptomyces aurantiacus TaxID=47760 RepID=UPI0012FF1192|nr:hypothetical protein [Streptomyces aurantiacus]